MIPTTFRMTNSTELAKKHKSEYFKANKNEIAFTKLINSIQVEKPIINPVNGMVMWGAK